MSVSDLFIMLGGLAVFLFGMNVMGNALERQADSRLRNILTHLTENPLLGFLWGLSTTAALQSSSAATVMVVGFVNSGLMQLHQAVGIIIGCNVGSTATSWLLTLAGLDGGSWPGIIAPLAAFIGILLYQFCRREYERSAGLVLLGFSVLLLGLGLISSAAAPLAANRSFSAMFSMLSNPILGVIAGAVLTAVLQSSSASIGILQALSVTGTITYTSAIPIIMGLNIGTCITALISSVGTNKNARRTAAIHLYFNLIGTAVFLLLFYSLDFLLQFSFADQAVNAVGISAVHTIFNLFAAALLLPFHRTLERLAVLTIPDDREPERFQPLDERLFATPALAVERARAQTMEMANLARSTMLQAMSLVHHWDSDMARQISANEDQTDSYEDRLGTYLVRLSSHTLSVEDSHSVSVLLHTIGDFERIGDHAVNLLDSARELHSKGLVLPENTRSELSVLESAVQEILNNSIESFQHADLDLARKVEPLEDTIDDLVREMKNRHIQRLQSGEDTILQGFVLSDLLTNYERIADHCSNIAVALIEVAGGKFDTHEYLSKIKTEEPAEFRERSQFYHYRYALPGAETGKKAGGQI